jgi:hypothetical protein
MPEGIQEDMNKRFLVAIILSVGLLSPSATFSSEIPDEQLNQIQPPQPLTGGYSGVYYDDQKTLQRAFYYVESGPNSADRLRTFVTCKSALDEPCKSDNFLFFETPLPPCDVSRVNDCLTSFSGGTSRERLQTAQFVETVTVNLIQYGGEGGKRYFTPYTGDPARGVPDSGYPSIWKMSHLPHQGGDEYLVVAKLNAEQLDTEGRKPVNLDVGVFPVSRVPGFQWGCFFNTQTHCLKRWPFPKGAQIELSLKTKSKIVGWFYGRVTDPNINSTKLDDGSTQLTINGAPTVVPIVAGWAKNSDLPKELDEMIEKEFIDRKFQFAGVCFFGCDSQDRSKQVVNDERNPSFTLQSTYNKGLFDRYLLWLDVLEDRAYASKSTWSFRTLADYSQYEKCLGSGGIAGLVTTNSNAYIATPPIFENEELLYRVASPHYDSKGNVQIGTYDLAIRSDVARCLYGFTEAPINATLNVIYEEGEAVNATTVVGEKNGWLYLSAKGFTYSSPTVKVKMTQEKPVPVVSVTPTPTPTPTITPVPVIEKTLAKKKTISCVKGAKTKKVSAVKPKCPKGYKKA